MISIRPLKLGLWRRKSDWLRVLGSALLCALICGAARADDESSDALAGFGTAAAVDGAAEAAQQLEGLEPGEGAIAGRVIDAENGLPVASVTVILQWPGLAEGQERRQEVEITDSDGAFEFSAVPIGRYEINFIKSGYRQSRMTNFEVSAGQINRADFPLPPLPLEASDQVMELDAFVVEAETVGDLVSAIELRMDSDSLLNIMSEKDFSKFAATDVAEAITRVAGVNVVEGQFAIIRGLEDRYSSTLYNSAPIPSPDPDRQSVQLDLFPAEVVSNLTVAKTFDASLPSNSSGGSIDIITLDYPETFTFTLKAKGGFNENAVDEFIEYEPGSPVGVSTDGSDVLNREFGAMLGGRRQIGDREFRFKGVFNRDIDFETAEGYQESSEPALAQFPRRGPQRSGDLSLGQLSLSAGKYDLTVSERSQQDTGYAALGFDLDEAGNHVIDLSAFYTEKNQELVQLNSNGYLPTMDYSTLVDLQRDGEPILNQVWNGYATISTWIARTVREDAGDAASRGPAWFTNFSESRSFERDRDLLVTQLNGSHKFDALEGLHIGWAANYARANQDETAQGAQIFFEPDDTNQIPTVFPSTAESLGPGRYAVNNGIYLSANDIEEKQGFARIDVDYERRFGKHVLGAFTLGGWYESADRDVQSSFLESPSVGGLSQFVVFGDTREQLGRNLFSSIDDDGTGSLSGLRDTTNESSREILAATFDAKATFWDDFDLLGGVRFEQIVIESRNDPFIGENKFGSPDIFPTRYLFFDRLDNPTRSEVIRVPPPGTTFNDQILGIDVPVDPDTGFVDFVDQSSLEAIVNGEIDESEILPALGINYRPIEGLSLRGAYSQTVARPSFREMGFYVSVEPASNDLVVGNPQLGLSDVESFDVRTEYVWGDLGDLMAFSAFYKTIEDPIESIIVRNPLNLELSSNALFRTFFNNPSDANLWGIEAEVRKSFDFLGIDILDYLSIGGNYTYIDAEVDRSEYELSRSEPFFGVANDDVEIYSGLSTSRRLFGQPEWIANADISFDHPEWGTRLTLAYFGISDVLTAAGNAAVGADGDVKSATLDRYVDSFYQLDLIASQDWNLPRNSGLLTFKFSAKNLTNTTRSIIYDPQQTYGRIVERSYKIGRDYSFSIKYSLSF